MTGLFLEKLGTGWLQCAAEPSSTKEDRSVLVGLSGGPDSVALLRGLLDLKEKLFLNVYAAHLNHQLRGPDSDLDETWVRQLCNQLNVPLVVVQKPVAQLASEQKLGVEETARKIRYGFLTETAQALQCAAVAVAHHADDQVETVLHQFVRGSGLRGLAGMPWSRKLNPEIDLVRPMLEIRRSEIETALGEWKQDSLEDGSNQDRQYTRNRIRNELLPVLEKSYNTQVSNAILSVSRQVKESQDLIESFARNVLQTAILESTLTGCRLDKGQLAKQPRHLVRECFVQLWRQNNWPRQQMNFAHWDRLAGVVFDETEGCSLPGYIQSKRVRKELHLVRNKGN